MRATIFSGKVVILISLGFILVVAAFILFNREILVPVRVALPWLNQAQFAGVYVADAKGLYKNEGIAVSLIERDFKGPLVIDLLSEGKADIAIISPGEFLSAINNGKDVVALAAVFQTSPTVIASLKEKDIRSPIDLRGKKVGLVRVNKESKLIPYALIREENIPESSVIFSEVGHNQVDSLLRGDVDAIAIYRTNELYELENKNIPYSLIFPERLGVDMYGDIIVVRKEYLLSHKKEIGGFLRATFRGWSFAEENPDEAVRIVFEVDNPKYHDLAREEYILKGALKMVRQYPKQTMGQMVPYYWNYTYDLFKKYGLVGNIEINKFFIDAQTYRELGFPEY